MYDCLNINNIIKVETVFLVYENLAKIFKVLVKTINCINVDESKVRFENKRSTFNQFNK